MGLTIDRTNLGAILRKNIVVFAIVSITMFAVTSFLTLATVTDYSIEIFMDMNGFDYAVLTFLMFAIISPLMGIYAALLVHRLQSSCPVNLKTDGVGFAGLASGILSTGCPMCGSVILELLGVVPFALVFLPFKGLEIRALSILLLLISIFLLKNR